MYYDFVPDILEVVSRLRSDDAVEVLQAHVRPPLNEEDITALRARFYRAIPQDLVDLYRTTNGMTLRWRYRSDLPEPHKRRIRAAFEPYTGRPEEAFETAGSIDLMPLEDVLFGEDNKLPEVDVEDDFDFDGRVYSVNEFSRLIHPFDAVSDAEAMAFVVQDAARWKLLLLGDYWIDYGYSRVTYLEDYLRYVVACRGVIVSRQALFNEYRGDRRGPVLFSEQVARAVMPSVVVHE